jgi:hypothetical protein
MQSFTMARAYTQFALNYMEFGESGRGFFRSDTPINMFDSHSGGTRFES